MFYWYILPTLVALHCMWWSSGYALQCYNWSGPALPRNVTEPNDLVELASAWVSGPDAKCALLSDGRLTEPSGNALCPEQQPQEDCVWRNGGTEDGDGNYPECGNELKTFVQYQLSYQSESRYSVHLQWDPIPGVSSTYNVKVSQMGRTCSSTVMNNTKFWFLAKYHFYDTTFETWTAKITVPGERCLSASVTAISPKDCLFLCPGMCACHEHTSYLYEAPVNLSSSCQWNRDTDIVSLLVSWDPVEKYYHNYPNNTFYLTLHNNDGLAMETLQVKGTTMVSMNLRGVNMTQSYSVQVEHIICGIKRLSKKFPLFLENCQVRSNAKISTRNNSSRNVEAIISTIEINTNSTAANDRTSTPLMTEHLPPDMAIMNIPILVGITVAFVTAALVLVTLLITLLAIFKKFQLKGKLKDISRLHPKGSKNGTDKTVLVLFSQASSVKDEMSVMEHVVKGVSLYSGVHCLYFDKPSVRTSVAEWVEGAIKRSDKVLLVVNKEFVKEWDSLKAYLPHGESLVYVARQVVDSFVMRDKQQLSKFALVFLRKEDQRTLLKDSLYLQTVKSFLVVPQAVAALEGLVRFILDVPTYTLNFNS